MNGVLVEIGFADIPEIAQQVKRNTNIVRQAIVIIFSMLYLEKFRIENLTVPLVSLVWVCFDPPE